MLREDGIYETADKLEKFIIKIAIFGILYIAPVLTVIACSTYEVIIEIFKNFFKNNSLNLFTVKKMSFASNSNFLLPITVQTMDSVGSNA